MPKNDKRDEYLRKAQEAAARAAKANDAGHKIAWEQIAESYRDLASQPERWLRGAE